MRIPLTLTLLGTPVVGLDGQPVTGFRSSKAQGLLYYLAVTGRPHTRPALAGLFWGDQPEAAARTSLSKCLSNLRDLVGDAVLIDRQTIAFNRNHVYHLDTERFETAVKLAPIPETVEALQAALALYRGDFLEGFYVRDAPDFEQWVLVQRAHYREAVIQGLHTLAQWHDQQDDLPQAISHTRRLLALEPWREEAHRQLMRRLARSGQRAAALRQYETCILILQAELNVEPDSETTALVEWLKRMPVEATGLPEAKLLLETSATQEAGLTNLPIFISSFVGRQRETEEIKDLLQGGQSYHANKLVTLTGAGGSGKTRLALQVAGALIDHYQNGVWWVDLAPLLDDTSLVLQTVAKTLGISEVPNQTLTDSLTQFLHKKQLLLVLDNCERLLTACVHLVNTLLRRCPTLSILTTSRHLLGIIGEQVYPVPTLTLPTSDENLSPDRSLGYEAIQLFVERSQALRPNFRLTEQNVAAVVQICRKLDGIPLAIELAAARVRLLRVEQIAVRLDERLHLLTAGNYSAPPRHQTLRATLDWSHDLLTAPERMLLRRLSVFAGRFSLDAVEQVCVPLSSSCLDLLAQLVDKSLVIVERESAEAEYRLLDTVREYAFEKLVLAGEETQIRMNHLNFFTLAAETVAPRIYDTGQGYWLLQLERIQANVHTALSWTIGQQKVAEALRLAGAMGQFWAVRGYWSEGSQWLKQALSQNYQGDSSKDLGSSLRSWRAAALLHAGVLDWRQCDFASARVLLEESRALYQSLADLPRLGYVLSLLAAVAFEQGEYEVAQSRYQESLAIARALGNKRYIGTILFGLGLVALNQQAYVAAHTYLDESLTLLQEIGHKYDIAHTLNALGNLANIQGEYGVAQTFYQETLLLRRELEDKRGVAATLGDVANATAKQEDHATAQRLYQESLFLFRELGNQRGIVYALSGLARIRQVQGHLQLATKLLATVEAQLTAMKARLDEPEHSDKEQAIAFLHTQLDAASFNTAWEEGRRFTLEQAITLARQVAE